MIELSVVYFVCFQLNGDQTATTRAGQNVGRYKYDRERKLGHRRVGDGGEITYKKIQSSHIMGSIQLGIQHTVSTRHSQLATFNRIESNRPMMTGLTFIFVYLPFV